MFYKQSLSKVSAVRMVIHDAKSKNLDSVYLVKSFGTFPRLNVKRRQILNVQNNIKCICPQPRTIEPFSIHSGVISHAYSSTITDTKPSVKVITIFHPLNLKNALKFVKCPSARLLILAVLHELICFSGRVIFF